MRVIVEFETSEIFNANAIGVIEQYLRGTFNAREAADLLGWSKTDWDSHMSAVFSVALKPFKPGVASVSIKESNAPGDNPL
jgi:hypothetical protein